MTRRFLCNVLGATAIALGASVPAAHAGVASVFNTASVLAPGAFSIAGEGLMRIDPYAFGGLGHVNYGVMPRMDLDVRIGYLDAEGGHTYVGADVEYALDKGERRESGIHVSATAGAHYWGDFGLDAALIGSWRQTTTETYVGVDTDIRFAEKTQIPVNLVLGVEAGLRRNIAFIAELGVTLHDSQNYASAGIAIYP